MKTYLKRFFAKCPPELLILTVGAFVTRLWSLSFPNQVVFDEVYFKPYAGDYLTHSYYFDPHPPLGKELLGLWSWIFHISATALTGSGPAVALRYLPAIAGALIIPVFYLFLRQLKAGRRVATLGAGFLLLDNALLVESRFILMDSMLILFGLAAVTTYLWARKLHGWQHWAVLILTALLAGMDSSIKLTGLGIAGVILLAWFIDVRKPNGLDWRKWLIDGAILIIIPALVYMAVFWVHFNLLTRTGQGDAFMPLQFQETIIGNPNYNPGVRLSFWTKFIDLNKEMQAAETSLDHATHPYASKWYTWPFMIRDVYYWQGPPMGIGNQGNIYLLGNPVVWWGTLAGIVLALVVLGRRLKERLRPYSYGIFFLIAAYLIALLPLSRIVRILFLYSYFYALCFSVALAAILVGVAAGWMGDDRHFWHFPSASSRNLYIGIFILAILGFAYFAPLSYGSPLSPAALQQHMWLKSWR